MADEENRCEHAGCLCVVSDDSEYCSDHCENAEAQGHQGRKRGRNDIVLRCNETRDRQCEKSRQTDRSDGIYHYALAFGCRRRRDQKASASLNAAAAALLLSLSRSFIIQTLLKYRSAGA